MPLRSSTFQLLVDAQLGVMGQAIGVPHKVYRITSTSTGNYPDGWTLLTSYAMVHKNRVRSNDVEAALTSERSLWYQIVADMSRFQLGDVFVQNSPDFFPGVGYGAGATRMKTSIEYNGFALAWHAVANPPLGARVDRRIAIYRPRLIPENGEWRSTHERDTPLVLSSGAYSWGVSGATASFVPAGFATSDRQTHGQDFPPDPPGMLPVARYYSYMPPLPGYTPAEGDAIIDEDGTRYVVIAPYTQNAGTVGSQVMMQRQISQND